MTRPRPTRRSQWSAAFLGAAAASMLLALSWALATLTPLAGASLAVERPDARVGNSEREAATRIAAISYGYDSSAASTTFPVNMRIATTRGERPAADGAPSWMPASGLSGATKVGAGLPALPARLAGGPKNVHVYRGIDENGEIVYSGITNDLKRRAAQHGDRFSALDPVTTSPVSRGEARAIEQALILRSRGQNQINAISPRHPYYDDAVKYGRAWLRDAGK